MPFNIGWTEMLVIGIVALIVVGPKDLPVMFRRAGEFFARMKGMAREFSTAMNDAARESGLEDVKKTIHTAANPIGSALDDVKSAASSFGDYKMGEETAKLSEERKAAAKKISDAAAKTATERMEKEAAQKSEQVGVEEGGKTKPAKTAKIKSASSKKEASSRTSATSSTKPKASAAVKAAKKPSKKANEKS